VIPVSGTSPKEVQEVKKAIREAVIVLRIITYFAAWMIVILILYKQSTPVAALVGIGLYVVSTLAILLVNRRE